MPGFSNLKATAALVALVTVVSAGTASAATTQCIPKVSQALSSNIGCEVSLSASQDFTQSNPLTVNGEAFFGSTNWVFENKKEFAEGSKVQSGTLTISSLLWSSYSQIMAIFKSGNENLVGFLLKPGDTSFTYTSPFFKNNGGTRDISHISIYGRDNDGNTGGPVGAVPVPAGLPLLASALGIGLFLRRRRS